jgi:DnaJ family protein A protein 2
VKLVEALCGAEFVVKHLDDRNIVVKTQPGILIRPGDVKAVDDEGMPMHKNPFVKVTHIILYFPLLPNFLAHLQAQYSAWWCTIPPNRLELVG